MFQQNLHAHSVWDDGQNTQEEMVQAARKAGLTSLGFSIHSYLPFAAEWTLIPEKLPEYTRAVKSLQEKYAGEFPVYFEDGTPNPKCDELRATIGLPPLPQSPLPRAA